MKTTSNEPVYNRYVLFVPFTLRDTPPWDYLGGHCWQEHRYPTPSSQSMVRISRRFVSNDNLAYIARRLSLYDSCVSVAGDWLPCERDDELFVFDLLKAMFVRCCRAEPTAPRTLHGGTYKHCNGWFDVSNEVYLGTGVSLAEAFSVMDATG